MERCHLEGSWTSLLERWCGGVVLVDGVSPRGQDNVSHLTCPFVL